jgi:hypothetical protein
MPLADAAALPVAVSVSGILDGAAGAVLLSGVRSALAGPAPVEVDLTGVTGHTLGGIAALRGCRVMTASAASRVHYRCGRGPDRAALLAATAVDRRLPTPRLV